MRSDTLVLEPSIQLRLHQLSMFPYESRNADNGLVEQPSYYSAITIDSEIQIEQRNLGRKTTTLTNKSGPSIPSRLEFHCNGMASVGEWIQITQLHNVGPETNPAHIYQPLITRNLPMKFRRINSSIHLSSCTDILLNINSSAIRSVSTTLNTGKKKQSVTKMHCLHTIECPKVLSHPAQNQSGNSSLCIPGTHCVF